MSDDFHADCVYAANGDYRSGLPKPYYNNCLALNIEHNVQFAKFISYLIAARFVQQAGLLIQSINL